MIYYNNKDLLKMCLIIFMMAGKMHVNCYQIK